MKKIIFGIGVLLIIITVVGAFFLYDRAAPSPETSKPYHNAEYRFSLEYPDELTVRETDEGSGAMTVTFEDAAGTRGFEIFIVPYAEDSVSDERFLHDQPSGVRNNAVATTVGGAPASAFYGFNPILGETYEVWFIHGGYLFETTTTKPLEAWLNDILGTLEFETP